ncbi:hypothetical protein DRH14_03585 [Candidatus Shapirobacteria bacterium]|nr:MAG: hypothetical protein DRH14_03585 [Candidatus Shapirobacteria bacterium]
MAGGFVVDNLITAVGVRSWNYRRLTAGMALAYIKGESEVSMRTLDYNQIQQKLVDKIQEAKDGGYTIHYKDNGMQVEIKLERPKMKSSQEFFDKKGGAK